MLEPAPDYPSKEQKAYFLYGPHKIEKAVTSDFQMKHKQTGFWDVLKILWKRRQGSKIIIITLRISFNLYEIILPSLLGKWSSRQDSSEDFSRIFSIMQYINGNTRFVMTARTKTTTATRTKKSYQDVHDLRKKAEMEWEKSLQCNQAREINANCLVKNYTVTWCEMTTSWR